MLARRLVRAFLHYSGHAGPKLADAITYRALFSVFAAVLLGFTVAAAWLGADARARAALVSAVDAAVPGLIGERGLIHLSSLPNPAGLTIAGLLSLVGLVGAAIGAISSTGWAVRTLAGTVAESPGWLRTILREVVLAAAVGVAVALSAAVGFFGTALIATARARAGPGLRPIFDAASDVLPVAVVFVLDGAVVALLFIALSGVRAPARTVVAGAALGALGLTVLQELSSLFVRGATSNPLLASFASLIALLLWMNLSAQTVLVATAYIIVGARERADRVRAVHGAGTLAEFHAQQAEDAVHSAVVGLQRARAAVDTERARHPGG